MKNKIAGLMILGVILSGCGGSSPDDYFTSSSSETGAGGEDDGEGGNDDDSSSSSGGGEDGEGGKGSSTSSSSSSGCQPSVSCLSVGAECGTILDDGCGNPIECPDNCTGNLTCGGGGDQFKCGCTPHTCLDMGLNCGEVDDGCGGIIDCGGCDNGDPYYSCGSDGPPNEFNQPGEPGQDNICNGGCTENTTVHAEYCFQTSGYKLVSCSDFDETIIPADNCYFYPGSSNPGNMWCCPM